MYVYLLLFRETLSYQSRCGEINGLLHCATMALREFAYAAIFVSIFSLQVISAEGNVQSSIWVGISKVFSAVGKLDVDKAVALAKTGGKIVVNANSEVGSHAYFNVQSSLFAPIL